MFGRVMSMHDGCRRPVKNSRIRERFLSYVRNILTTNKVLLRKEEINIINFWMRTETRCVI